MKLMNLLNNHFRQKQKGFAALTVSIIISAILLSMMAGAAGIAWRAALRRLIMKIKNQRALAQTCAQAQPLNWRRTPLIRW